MNTGTINQDQLKELTGYEKPAEIASCLSRQGIPYFIGKRGRVWTTLDAVNVAIGARNNEDGQQDTIEV
ncbi:DUF4224 domain-containing protein [Thermodesulfobacteriota bacterium]